MRKYLNMENATLEMNFSALDDYYSVVNNNQNAILSQNFKRIIFHISELDLSKFIDNINAELKNKETLIMIYSFITLENIELELPENFIIVNTNERNILINEKVFNLVKFTKKSKDLILSNINKNLIIEPVIDVNNISMEIENLNILINEINGNDINLGGFMLSSFIMREHPCNAYLCNGWNCKKRISGLPKHIYINEKMDIYPHDLFYKVFYIGNIRNRKIDELLEEYYKSKEYNNFIDYCKKVFTKYLSKYPYELVPFIEYVRLEVLKDEQ